MKRIQWIGCMLGATLLFSPQRATSLFDKKVPIPSGVKMLVAHAAGGLDGKTYTNSMDALDANYKLGFRFFEVDFAETTDGHLVGVHSWKRLKGPVDFSTFQSMKLNGRWTTLTLGRLKVWLALHPDASIITDFKRVDPERFYRTVRTVLGKDQIIPQIYRYEDYERVQKLGFQKIILALYKMRAQPSEVISFSATHQLFAVNIPRKQSLHSGLPAALQRLGVPCMIHVVNPPQAQSSYTEGVTMYMTDFLRPSDLSPLETR